MTRPHKIHKLSARFNKTIYAVEIEADLRTVFYVEGDVVVTVDIGSHDLYRGEQLGLSASLEDIIIRLPSRALAKAGVLSVSVI